MFPNLNQILLPTTNLNFTMTSMSNSRFQTALSLLAMNLKHRTLIPMANLNTLFDEIKDTENTDPKLKELLQGLIENVNTKGDILVGLKNWVQFLENKVNEMERHSSKDCVILLKLPLRSRNFTQVVLAFFNEVMVVEVKLYDLKACHPLGPVSQNQKMCSHSKNLSTLI